jgi:hypothetical protein
MIRAINVTSAWWRGIASRKARWQGSNPALDGSRTTASDARLAVGLHRPKHKTVFSVSLRRWGGCAVKSWNCISQRLYILYHPSISCSVPIGFSIDSNHPPSLILIALSSTTRCFRGRISSLAPLHCPRRTLSIYESLRHQH